MGEKLSWDQISKAYDSEWVELIDYQWDESSPYPSSGVVRVHSKNRGEFEKLASEESPLDSAYIFIGKRLASESHVLAYNRIVVVPFTNA
jgi:hypothetical protein